MTRPEEAGEVSLTALGELAGSVAQALGGPLTAMTMALDRLRRHVPNGGETNGDHQVLEEQLARMAYLADTLRALSLPLRPKARAVDLNRIAGEVVRATRPALADAGIGVELSLAEGLPPAEADPNRLREVLLSLVYNARQALDGWEGSRTVSVETRMGAEGTVELDVCDSGPGVPEGDEERIFLPFVSGWGREGVGLSVSRLALLGQGGELRVDPARKPGACFRIRLRPHPEALQTSRSQENVP